MEIAPIIEVDTFKKLRVRGWIVNLRKANKNYSLISFKRLCT